MYLANRRMFVFGLAVEAYCELCRDSMKPLWPQKVIYTVDIEALLGFIFRMVHKKFSHISNVHY